MLAIYARISGIKEDDSDVSISFQISKGKELAKELNLNYRIYKDEGVSGTSDPEDRKGLKDVLLDIISGEVKILFAWHQYRLYRADSARIKVQAVCKKHKVKIYYDKVEYDWNDPMSKMVDTIMTATGQFYVDLTKQHVKGVIQQNYEHGKAHGSIPYGWMKGNNKILVVDPYKAEVVKRIFNEEIEGKSISQITKGLNNDSIPSPRGAKWHKGTVTKMLSHRMYIGERPYLNKYVPIPPIISKETFKKAEQARKANSNNRGKINMDRFYLRGLLWCDSCGNRYLGNMSKYPYYQCATRRNDSTACANKNIRATVLDDFIWYILTFMLLEEVESMVEKDTGKDELEFRLKELRDKLSDLDKQKRRQAELAVKGNLPIEILDEQLKRIEKEEGECDKEINEVQTQLKSYEVDYTEELEGLKDVINANTTFKKKVVNKFLLKVLVIQEGELTRLDVFFKIKSITFSFYIDTKKGFIIDRKSAGLYIFGKMLIKAATNTENLYRWFHNIPEIDKLHQHILDTQEEEYSGLLEVDKYGDDTKNDLGRVTMIL